MPPSAAPSRPEVSAADVTFVLTDPHRQLARVRLVQELGLDSAPGAGLAFTREPGGWRLRMPRPDADRMEYLFDVEDHNGHRATITDPANPLQVPGAFGAKSELRFPAYRSPAWLELPVADHIAEPFSVGTGALDDAVSGVLWSPRTLASGTPAPLLVVHDGPEYERLGSFTHYLGVSIATGVLPPLRAALLGPGDRNAWYSANPAYADALCADVLPGLDTIAPTTIRLGVGVSLGGLALLHAHRAYPTVFGGLFLQSGSFFTPDLDPQESNFSGFAAVTRFVADVTAGADDVAAEGIAATVADQQPIVMTCGRPEENLANNRRMAATLTTLGYRVELHELRDGHNYTAWRDALDPHLTALLTSLVAAHAS